VKEMSSTDMEDAISKKWPVLKDVIHNKLDVLKKPLQDSKLIYQKTTKKITAEVGSLIFGTLYLIQR
jgi:hypothetical protein